MSGDLKSLRGSAAIVGAATFGCGEAPGYADIEFPFEEMPYPEMTIDRVWELGEFLGYLSTWSAVRRVNEAGRDDILEGFVRDVSSLWGEPTRKLPISWPINMRLGKI